MQTSSSILTSKLQVKTPNVEIGKVLGCMSTSGAADWVTVSSTGTSFENIAPVDHGDGDTLTAAEISPGNIVYIFDSLKDATGITSVIVPAPNPSNPSANVRYEDSTKLIQVTLPSAASVVSFFSLHTGDTWTFQTLNKTSHNASVYSTLNGYYDPVSAKIYTAKGSLELGSGWSTPQRTVNVRGGGTASVDYETRILHELSTDIWQALVLDASSGSESILLTRLTPVCGMAPIVFNDDDEFEFLFQTETTGTLVEIHNVAGITGPPPLPAPIKLFVDVYSETFPKIPNTVIIPVSTESTLYTDSTFMVYVSAPGKRTATFLMHRMQFVS